MGLAIFQFCLKKERKQYDGSQVPGYGYFASRVKCWDDSLGQEKMSVMPVPKGGNVEMIEVKTTPDEVLQAEVHPYVGDDSEEHGGGRVEVFKDIGGSGSVLAPPKETPEDSQVLCNGCVAPSHLGARGYLSWAEERGDDNTLPRGWSDSTVPNGWSDDGAVPNGWSLGSGCWDDGTLPKGWNDDDEIVLMTGYLVPAGLRATMFPVGGNTNRGAGMITIYLKAGVMTILFPLGGNTNRGVGDQDLFVDVPDKQGQVVPDGMLAIFRAIWDPGTDPACAEDKEIRYHQFGIANNPELKVSVDVEKAAGATPEEPLLPYQELRKHVPEVRCHGGHDDDSKELALVKNNKHPVFVAWSSSQMTFCNQTTLA